MKYPIIALCALVAALFVARLTDTKDIQREIDRNPHLAPNATQHVRPTTPHGVDTLQFERNTMTQLAATLSAELPIKTANVLPDCGEQTRVVRVVQTWDGHVRTVPRGEPLLAGL